MEKPITDKKLIRDMFQPPDWLVEQTRAQQADAPYCGLGFRKGRLEPELHARMLENIQNNAHRYRSEHSIGEIQSVETGVIPCLYYEDREFNDSVLEALKPAHENWSGMTLAESACYGFRVYQRGTYLHNHVDHTRTHIVSSTICVDYRLDEPWPLYIEDINGTAYQVDLEPGEFVFYEGARLIHGRPWPLKGQYYIGMFVHYRPRHFSSGPTAKQ